MCNAPRSGALLGETIVAAKRRRRVVTKTRRRSRSHSRVRQRARVDREDARLRALHAVAVMRREGRSLQAAASRAGVAPRTVLAKARQALRKREGRYSAVPLDELRRPMRVLTERGLVVLDVTSSRAASRLAKYWNAVDTYLRTGDRRALAPYAGRSFTAESHRMSFVTDPRLLDRLAHAAEVTFEDLYESST